MKTTLLTIFACLAATSILKAQEPDLESILAKYYSAVNMEKLAAVQSVVMTGTIVQQDLMPVKIYRLRPDRYLMEYDVADLTAYLGFDGTAGWFTAPWTGNAAAQKAAPDREADLRIRADIDGVLYKWKEKGHLPELVGADTVDRRPSYRIKVTRKDGGIEYHLLDAETFLPARRISTRMAGGKEIPVETTYRDYRKVSGIFFPFKVETNNGGRVNEIQFDLVEVDVPVKESIFGMP